MDALTHWLDPHTLLTTDYAYVALFLIVFAESGMLVGFFLPGDSLLIIAGVLAAAGHLSLFALIPLVFVAGVLGDQIGYFLGFRFGRRILKQFKEVHITKSEAFFAKHGHKTIILARFVPIVRTFVPVLAGISAMPYRRYLGYDLVGGVLWGIGIVLVGYFIGTIPGLNHSLNLIIAIIIGLSILPVLIHIFKPKSSH